MTWTAPAITRTSPPYVGNERAMLDGWLDYHRQTLLLKCAGLTAEQLKTASVEPANLTLLGLVRHMAEVERWWFRIHFAGEPIDTLYWSDDNPDGDFDDVPGADPEADFATFLAEVEASRRTTADRDLDETFHRTRDDGSTVVLSLRWAYVHMIEEYARHNGHADLIRERIDGTTGQ
ncbi:DinB family protein [Plantactinospora sp. B5E13]|uniref:DinB family protein n=1 Tax=unclassified Plantactinospora TaxID=2631981 RepID=UPI00325E0498